MKVGSHVSLNGVKGLGWLGVFAAVSDQPRPEIRPPQIPHPDSAWGLEKHRLFTAITHPVV